MNKFIDSFVLAILFSLSSSSFASNIAEQPLRNLLEKWCQQQHIAGASVSIFSPKMHSPHTIVYGTMSLYDKQKVDSHTLFQVGGITKTYIATLILLLESQKQFTLSQRIGPWFPQYKTWRNITILQLLNMTSGIPGDFKSKSLLYKPGYGWNYSDINYILLRRIIKKTTGLSVTQQLQQQLFMPLQLFSTSYVPPNKFNDVPGTIVATTADIAKFYYQLFTGNILRKQQMAQMMTPYSIKTGQQLAANSKMTAFGLGMNREWIAGRYIWFKPGRAIGQIALVAISAKKHIVVSIAATKPSHAASISMVKELMPKIYMNIKQ